MRLERLTDRDELGEANERMLGCAIFAAERDAELRRLRAHHHDSAFSLLQFRDSKTAVTGTGTLSATGRIYHRAMITLTE